ncbi:hypothetical protein G9A89_014670 [Geosiphon pyriformis]|nr:hypothetical protein G9A89_014670 [Geosiphon pyriformis]
MYTNAKIDGHSIKLILDSGSADSIITKQFMDQLSHQINQAASTRIVTTDGTIKTLISEIDNLPFEINSIITLIKVLVMKATQYQALVGNDWLSKTNAMLDWTTQKLQISQNGQHMQMPVTCGHFRPSTVMWPLIDFKEEREKPIWEAYQVSWADKNHNELLPILFWNNNKEGKQKEKLT